jgi:hypothetical protein
VPGRSTINTPQKADQNRDPAPRPPRFVQQERGAQRGEQWLGEGQRHHLRERQFGCRHEEKNHRHEQADAGHGETPGLPCAQGMQAEPAEKRQDHQEADQIAEQRDLEQVEGGRGDADRAQLHRDATAAEQHQQCRPDEGRQRVPPARQAHDAALPASSRTGRIRKPASARAGIGV